MLVNNSEIPAGRVPASDMEIQSRYLSPDPYWPPDSVGSGFVESCHSSNSQSLPHASQRPMGAVVPSQSYSHSQSFTVFTFSNEITLALSEDEPKHRVFDKMTWELWVKLLAVVNAAFECCVRLEQYSDVPVRFEEIDGTATRFYVDAPLWKEIVGKCIYSALPNRIQKKRQPRKEARKLVDEIPAAQRTIHFDAGTLQVANDSLDSIKEGDFQFAPFSPPKKTSGSNKLPLLFRASVSPACLSLFTKQGFAMNGNEVAGDHNGVSGTYRVSWIRHLLSQPDFNHRNIVEAGRFQKVMDLCMSGSGKLDVLGMVVHPCKIVASNTNVASDAEDATESQIGPCTKLEGLKKEEWRSLYNAKCKDKIVFQVTNNVVGGSNQLLGQPHAEDITDQDIDSLCGHLTGYSVEEWFIVEEQDKKWWESLSSVAKNTIRFATLCSYLDSHYDLADPTGGGWTHLLSDLRKGPFRGLGAECFRLSVIEDVIMWCHILMQILTPLDASMLDGLCRENATKQALLGVDAYGHVLRPNMGIFSVLGKPNPKVDFLCPNYRARQKRRGKKQVAPDHGKDGFLRQLSSLVQNESDQMTKRSIQAVLLAQLKIYANNKDVAAKRVCSQEQREFAYSQPPTIPDRPFEPKYQPDATKTKFVRKSKEDTNVLNHLQVVWCMKRLLSAESVANFPVLSNIFGETQDDRNASLEKIYLDVVPDPRLTRDNGSSNYIASPFSTHNIRNLSGAVVPMAHVLLHFLKYYLYVHRDSNNNLSNMVELVSTDGQVGKKAIAGQLGCQEKDLFFPTGKDTGEQVLKMYSFFGRNVEQPAGEITAQALSGMKKKLLRDGTSFLKSRDEVKVGENWVQVSVRHPYDPYWPHSCVHQGIQLHIA